MKGKNLSLLKCFLMSRYLIIILTIVFITSCEKEYSNPNQTYNFHDYFFIENIECYDIIGNRFDSLSYRYSQDDFIRSDELILPYEKIDINSDNTVEMHYTEDGVKYNKSGRVTQKNDTLYFYSSDLSIDNLLFRGLIVDNQLKILGYGYIYYIFLSNGGLNMIHENKIVAMGIPDLENLLKEFPSISLSNSNININNLYIQRFDLIYEMKYE